MYALGPALRGLEANTLAALSALDVRPACLQASALLACLPQGLSITEFFRGTLDQLIVTFGISAISCSDPVGWDERQTLQRLARSHPQLSIFTDNTTRALEADELPFPAGQLPASFSQFRKQVETIASDKDFTPAAAPNTLPPPPAVALQLPEHWALPPGNGQTSAQLTGGEKAGLRHLKNYFSSDLPSRYKVVRNHLDGWHNSTKFSPWLATGCLSPHQVLAQLFHYEQQYGANESTYWIRFELLWREYFQWYSLQYGRRLFRFSGIKHTRPLTSFFAQRFQQWCQGSTPYPLINACMNQLNQTGFISNRARQIVASCLVNELQLDWRYGAAYFEQKLVDYDVANNWGNWQYLAGVGCDPRGQRHFDLAKQAKQFDPFGQYSKQWGGHRNTQPLDSVDASDWPTTPA